MRVLSFLLALFLTTNASAQDVAPPPVGVPPDTAGMTDVIFSKVEVESVYPGGVQAWGKYLGDEFNRRKIAKKATKNGISYGRHKAILRFIVERDGTIKHVEVLKPIGYGVDEELVKIFTSSRRWRPGSHNGKKVRSYYTQPFEFIIERE